MFMYCTGGYGPGLIQRIEVERTSKSSVWFDGQRRALKSTWGQNFWNTWDEARDHLLENATAKVATDRRNLENSNGFLGNVKGLKKPTPR